MSKIKHYNCMDCKYFTLTKKDRYGKHYIWGGTCPNSHDVSGTYMNGGCGACKLFEPKEEVKKDGTE